jgi:hypothetical protein
VTEPYRKPVTPGNQAGSPRLPAQTGSRRLAWPALPVTVTAEIERLLGRRVVAAASQPGGFSAGLAARVTLSDGTGAFVKAVHAPTAPAVASFHRQEIAVSRYLPAGVPAPHLLHAHDDGEWVVLAFEEIHGNLPAQPWQRAELDRVLAAATELAAILTPAPAPAPVLRPPRLGGWGDLRGHAARARLRAICPWAADHLADLAVIEAAAEVTGPTLLHGDMYPFNILLTTDRVVFVDWPHAWIGAPFCDVVTLLSGARLSGIDPQPIADGHPLTRGLAPEQIDGLLALHSGFLLRNAVLAEPAADPSMVEMMIALGSASVQWLRDRWP